MSLFYSDHAILCDEENIAELVSWKCVSVCVSRVCVCMFVCLTVCLWWRKW